ncbi:MAG: site-2 protease family protein [Chloroflexi bacterium]|nr:site-2 protease family protein [Chloroflexota bacterium]
MPSIPEPEVLRAIVSRVFRIEDYAFGNPQQDYIVRYRGALLGDSVAAYDQLAAALRPLDITPLFRWDGDRHAVILVTGVIRPKPSKPSANIVLFILTVLSVLLSGFIYAYEGPEPASLVGFVRLLLLNLWRGWPFALSLLSILLAHEFGHYLAGRYHKTAVSLPYFLPFPFSLLGTLGAFIQLKEPPRNKRVLLDIGIAGPIAGLAVAIPVLLLGLWLSPTDVIRAHGCGFLEGNSLLYLLAKFAVFHKWLPAPASYGGLPPLLYWARYFFTGRPLPLGGADVILHPVALAAWAGLLVTALNLIPSGQLDGGHIVYVLLGKRARALLPFLLVLLAGMGFFWSGWWLWAFLIFMLGHLHAEPLDQITTLDPRRKMLAALGLLVFILTFTPVPFVVY